MNELQVFTNPEFGQVRTVTIEEEPWFVGKDVAVALGYESPRAAVSKKVDPEDKGVSEMETPSGRQQMTIINESGLYALIFGSKLESRLAVTLKTPDQVRILQRCDCGKAMHRIRAEKDMVCPECKQPLEVTDLVAVTMWD